MNTPARSIIAAAVIVIAAGVSWIGIKQYQRRRSLIACQERDAALTHRLESIKRDAREQLKIGAKKADISRFFAEHGMAFYIEETKAFGTLQATGCGPAHCGDGVLIGVRVKVDLAESVAGEPAVETLYIDCP